VNIEELLRTAADDVAASVRAPDTDPDAILAAARRRTRHRVAAGAGVAVVALVVALIVVRHGDGDRGPAPVPTPTPSPVPLVVHSAPVWGDANGVHDGNRDHALPAGGAPHVVAPVANGTVVGDFRGRVWFQPRSGDPVEVGRYEQPMLAGGGDNVAAWMERVDGGVDLVVFDTNLLQEVGRSRAAGGTIAPDGQLNGDRVANPGPFFYVGRELVIYGSTSGTWAYDVATRKFRHLDPDLPYGAPVDHARDVSALVNVSQDWDAPDFLRRTVTFWVLHEGQVSSASGVEPSGAFNHAGTRFAAVVDVSGGRHHVVVVDVGTGRMRALTPATRLYTRLSWGRGEVLMVQQFRLAAERGKDQLLACDVRRSRCREVPFVGEIPVLPAA
jgi:hypothetical protein